MWSQTGPLVDSFSSALEVVPPSGDEVPVDTYVVSCDGATGIRTATLDSHVDTYVVSRNVGSIHGSARSTTLELSMSLSHLRLLGCAGALCIVQGVHHLGWLFVQIYFTRGDVYVFCPDLHVLQCWVLL